MKSFQIVTLFAILASALAFAPNQVPKIAKAILPVAALPVAGIAPAFALDSIIESLPSSTVALEVQFAAYLAVILGTFLPALFLINLYIQSESRKAGRAGGQDSE